MWGPKRRPFTGSRVLGAEVRWARRGHLLGDASPPGALGRGPRPAHVVVGVSHGTRAPLARRLPAGVRSGSRSLGVELRPHPVAASSPNVPALQSHRGPPPPTALCCDEPRPA